MGMSSVIEVALGELGTVEDPPGSNLTKYGAEYGLNGKPWCVVFLWWVFRKAGLAPLFYGGGRVASCGTLLRWAEFQGLMVPVDAIKPGDVPILNFHGTRDTEHCGLVVDNISSGAFETVEGNTSTGAGSQDNGGIVAKKTRYAHQVVGVFRPAYQTLDYVGHWGENAMRWGIEKGYIHGYEDGSFRPDGALTRAEAMTILMRHEEGRK